MKLSVSPNTTYDVRFSGEFCQEQNQCIEKRQEFIFNRMQQNYSPMDAPRTIAQTPNIAVIGSGGGFRAMIGFSGVIAALESSGLLDEVLFICGLSGSAWLLSTLYSSDDWLDNSVGHIQNRIRSNIHQSPLRFLSASYILRYYNLLSQRHNDSLSVSFTDIFGDMLGCTLLQDRSSTLSDQISMVTHNNKPIPIYSSVIVEHKQQHSSTIATAASTTTQQYNSSMICENPLWIEFTPFQTRIILSSDQSWSVPAEYFSSKFFCGCRISQHPQLPLSYLQGLWGNAYCILFKQWLLNNKSNELDTFSMFSEPDDQSTISAAGTDSLNTNETKSYWTKLMEGILMGDNLLNRTTGRAATVHNFLYGLPIDTKNDEVLRGERINLVDAGLALNSPYPIILRQSVHIDLILSFDYSVRKSDSHPPFKNLIKAYNWAKHNRIPFPEIDLTQYKQDPNRLVYIFQDNDNIEVPTILHFVLVNTTFRNYSKPDLETFLDTK